MKFVVIRLIEWACPATGPMEGQEMAQFIRDIEIIDFPDVATANRFRDDLVEKYDLLQDQFHEYFSDNSDVDFSISIHVDPLEEQLFHNGLWDSDSAIGEYSGRLLMRGSTDIWPEPPTKSIVMKDFDVKLWIETYG